MSVALRHSGPINIGDVFLWIYDDGEFSRLRVTRLQSMPNHQLRVWSENLEPDFITGLTSETWHDESRFREVCQMEDTPAKTVPGYWMNETTGVLRPAVEAYLAGGAMTDAEVAAMRAYLRQWMAGDWHGPAIPGLRARVDGLTTAAALRTWMRDAFKADIDPL